MTKIKKKTKCFSMIWEQVAKIVPSKVKKEVPPKEKPKDRTVKELLALREDIKKNLISEN